MKYMCKILFATFGALLFTSTSAKAQEQYLLQFIVKGAENHHQIEQLNTVLSELSGAQLSRTDFNSRCHTAIIQGDVEYSREYFEVVLAEFGLEVGCFQMSVYMGQPLKPLNARDCIRNIEELSADRNGPCCSAHASFGCLNGPCQTFVCSQDGFCCASNWDGICANIAIANANSAGVCAGVTNCPGTSGGGAGPCCSANSGPGCQNSACQTAVCAQDAFCCNSTWDAICANIAIANANSGGACAGISNCPTPVAAPCCSANSGIGCENTACQVAVCNLDAFCCTIVWDAFCAAAAIDNANLGGACSGISNCPTSSGGGAVTASDCQDAVDVCSDINFSINPNGFGTTNEICLCCVANPCTNPVSANYGCLLAGELNSTWMIVNIEQGGTLEFTFGGLGTQAGFYDWAMWTYNDLTCNAVMSNSVAPIRCNWNGASTGGTGLASTLPPGGSPTNYEPPLNVSTGQQYLICFSNYSSVTTNVPLQFYGSALVSCSPILVLPVELIAFKAEADQLDAIISWTTASETNNDFFKLQRSFDSRTWEDIEIVNGSGNSTQIQQYKVIDPHPGQGVIYYRLLQYDFDGTTQDHGVVAVSLQVDLWTVYPNPSSESWNLIIQGNHSNLTFDVYDLQGNRMAIQTTQLQNSIEINILNRTKGIYFLTVYNAQGFRLFNSKILAQ